MNSPTADPNDTDNKSESSTSTEVEEEVKSTRAAKYKVTNRLDNQVLAMDVA